LILLTNDGELAQRLTHPKFGVRKVYRVTVAGKVDTETMKQMRKGVYIAEGFVKVEGAKLLKSRSRSTEMEIVLREGKNREIRRILARLGHKVQHLRRIAVGPLRLGDVPPGAYRVLSHQEVDKLWQVTETSSDASPKKLVRKKPGKAKSGGTKTGGKRTTGKQYVGKQPAKKSNRRPVKKPAEEFVFDESQTIGSVIGADATPTSDAPDRRTRSTKGKRKGRTSERQTTEKRDGKKSAGRKSSSSSGRPKRRGKTSSPVTGKRGGTKRGSVKHGTKRGTKRKHSGRNRKH
jgi:23S rRNA pseudouridine2605 synthase